jgi:hypothetical protein
MNKIVKDHYPVTELPEDLRTSFPNGGYVRITVEWAPPRKSLNELLAELRLPEAQAVGEGVTINEAVARVRALRDEWDD